MKINNRTNKLKKIKQHQTKQHKNIQKNPNQNKTKRPSLSK